MKWQTVTAKKLIFYCDSTQKIHHQLLYAKIIEECLHQGIAGASVVQCVAGYGKHATLHTTHLFSLSENLPIRIEIIETEQHYSKALEILVPYSSFGLLTIEDVQIVQIEKEESGS